MHDHDWPAGGRFINVSQRTLVNPHQARCGLLSKMQKEGYAQLSVNSLHVIFAISPRAYTIG